MDDCLHVCIDGFSGSDALSPHCLLNMVGTMFPCFNSQQFQSEFLVHLSLAALLVSPLFSLARDVYNFYCSKNCYVKKASDDNKMLRSFQDTALAHNMIALHRPLPIMHL